MGWSTDIFSPEPSPGIICSICHDVLENASSLKECGHTYCARCIRVCLERVSPSCPNCRVAVTGINPNYALRDVIESMPVRCPGCKSDDDDDEGSKNSQQGDEDSDGCDWSGTVKELNDHQKVCELVKVRCPIEGCEHTCRRKDMERHLSSNRMMHMVLRHEQKMNALDEKYTNLWDTLLDELSCGGQCLACGPEQ